MRLIGLHVENFGKLCNYDYDFLPGLNVFECPNGWGKSTLRTFLTVMLYDFNNEGAKSNAQYNSERKRFMPWQGGIYGGSLTYEVEGKCYVLTRQFGQTAKGDIYEIREMDTNLVVTNEKISLGKKYLGIDRESFVKSVCIEQNGCETVATDDMNAKFGGNVIADDMRVYQRVAREINERITQLGSTRNTSVISRHNSQITEMETKVRNGSVLDKAIEEKMELLEGQKNSKNGLIKEREMLVEEQKKLSRYAQLKGKKDQYEAICEDVLQRHNKLEQAKKEFPGEIPAKSELEPLISEATNLEMKREAIKLAALNDGQLSQYQSLGARFAIGVPDEGEMEQVSSDIKIMNGLRVEQAQRSLSKEELREIEILSELFEANPLINTEVEKVQADMTKASEIKTNLVGKNANKSTLQLLTKQNQERNENKNRNIKLVLTVLGIFALVLGIALLWKYMVPGIITAILGVGLVVLGFLFGKKVTESSDEDMKLQELQKDIDNDEATLNTLNNNVRSFIEKYGRVYDSANVSSVIYELKAKWDDYCKLNSKAKILQNGNYEERIREVKDSIKGFLGRYISLVGIEEKDYQDCFNDVENSIINYNSLLEKKQGYDKLKEEETDIWNRVKGYMLKLSMDVAQNPLESLNKIKISLVNYDVALAEYQRATEIKQDFESAVNVTELTELAPYGCEYTLAGIGDKLEEIDNKLTQIKENISKYEKDIEECQEARNELSELEVIIVEEKEKLEQEMWEHGILESTKTFLDSAKVALTKRYMGPLKTGFDKYYKLMTGEEGDNYYIDANANLEIMEAGAQREVKFLSSGYRDLVGLCMRMAFVDAMYKNEKPFVIMDDPFVNLDDDKLLGGLRFVSEVAKEYQVIYFTCHNGRRSF